MDIQRIPIHELTPEQWQAWSDLQQSHTAYASPFLRPEYTQLVATERDNVEVTILSEDGLPVGFLPIEVKGRVAKAPGFPFTMREAVIVKADADWSVEQLLSGCQLKAYKYSHLITGQLPFQSYSRVQRPTFCINLSQGFEAYCQSKREEGSRVFTQIGNRRRKLEREVGPLEIANVPDDDSLQTLVEWKNEQCKRTGVASIYAFPWVQHFLRRTLELTADSLRGELWSLRVHGKLAAVNLLLRSYQTAYVWVLGHEPTLGKYAPGNVLLAGILRQLPETGIRLVDLGTGENQYKSRLMTHIEEVSEGCVDLRPTTRAAWHTWLQLRNVVRHSPLRGSAHRVDRVLADIRRKLGRQY